jgi:hypothetical protein
MRRTTTVLVHILFPESDHQKAQSTGGVFIIVDTGSAIQEADCFIC